VLEHWKRDRFAGAACLEMLRNSPHPELDKWRREVRNKSSAHVDADVDIWAADLPHWPMTIDELINEALRVITAARDCAALEVRSKFFFMPPTYVGGEKVLGLADQEGRYWRDG
jgi:hypothetical protein